LNCFWTSRRNCSMVHPFSTVTFFRVPRPSPTGRPAPPAPLVPLMCHGPCPYPATNGQPSSSRPSRCRVAKVRFRVRVGGTTGWARGIPRAIHNSPPWWRDRLAPVGVRDLQGFLSVMTPRNTTALCCSIRRGRRARDGSEKGCRHPQCVGMVPFCWRQMATGRIRKLRNSI